MPKIVGKIIEVFCIELVTIRPNPTKNLEEQKEHPMIREEETIAAYPDEEAAQNALRKLLEDEYGWCLTGFEVHPFSENCVRVTDAREWSNNAVRTYTVKEGELIMKG